MMKIYQSRERTKNLCFQKSRTIKFSQGKCPREFHNCRKVKRRRLKDSAQLTPCPSETASCERVGAAGLLCFLLKEQRPFVSYNPNGSQGYIYTVNKSTTVLLGALRNLYIYKKRVLFLNLLVMTN